LNTLDRPGVLSGLRGASHVELQKIVDLWDLQNVEIIAAAPIRKKILSYREDIETTIIETIARRPCTLDDLSAILGLHINELNKYLSVLESENKLETISQERGIFYKIKNNDFLGDANV
jgi:hypothetical protein